MWVNAGRTWYCPPQVYRHLRWHFCAKPEPPPAGRLWPSSGPTALLRDDDQEGHQNQEKKNPVHVTSPSLVEPSLIALGSGRAEVGAPRVRLA